MYALAAPKCIASIFRLKRKRRSAQKVNEIGSDGIKHVLPAAAPALPTCSGSCVLLPMPVVQRHERWG